MKSKPCLEETPPPVLVALVTGCKAASLTADTSRPLGAKGLPVWVNRWMGRLVLVKQCHLNQPNMDWCYFMVDAHRVGDGFTIDLLTFFKFFNHKWEYLPTGYWLARHPNLGMLWNATPMKTCVDPVQNGGPGVYFVLGWRASEAIYNSMVGDRSSASLGEQTHEFWVPIWVKSGLFGLRMAVNAKIYINGDITCPALLTKLIFLCGYGSKIRHQSRNQGQAPPLKFAVEAVCIHFAQL